MFRYALMVGMMVAMLFSAPGHAQRMMGGGMAGHGPGNMGGMPKPGMCKHGMPHHVCVERCVALGGVGGGPANPMCAHRCTRMGCQEAGFGRHAPH